MANLDAAQVARTSKRGAPKHEEALQAEPVNTKPRQRLTKSERIAKENEALHPWLRRQDPFASQPVHHEYDEEDEHDDNNDDDENDKDEDNDGEDEEEAEGDNEIRTLPLGRRTKRGLVVVD